MMPDFSARSRQDELMDAPDVDPAALDHAMRHLEFINQWLNGYGPTLAGIEALLPCGVSSFSLLDVGCGSGDTLKKIATWARKRRLEVALTGVELSERSAERAADKCRDYPEITIQHGDFMAADESATYDIAHCALVLHHFSDDTAASDLLAGMATRARMGIVVNDLHRHPLAWHSIYYLTRIFSQSPILQNDAPLSVARSFTRNELVRLSEDAGLKDMRIDWHWAFRWLLTARGAAANGAA